MLIALKVLLPLIAVLPVTTMASTEDKSFCMSQSQDEECSGYAFRIVKPMLEYFEKVNKELKAKDEEIAKLKNIIQGKDKIISGNKKPISEKNICEEHKKRCEAETAELEDKLELCNNRILSLNETNQELQPIQTECKEKSNIKIYRVDNFQKKLDEYLYVDFGYYTGIVKLEMDTKESFLVPYEPSVAGLGWTVIQRRKNGEENFYRNWLDYKNGFGKVDNDFWIGLERLYRILSQQRFELYIHLVDQENVTRYAKYDNFQIGSNEEKYKLKSIGRYNGNAGNSLEYHVGSDFSTFDSDIDPLKTYCALFSKGGWWYNSCAHSNLNGKNFDCDIKNSTKLNDAGCIYWQHWHGQSYSLKEVLMMIRPYLG